MGAPVKTIVLNGWAASPHAWDLCKFHRDALFSYTEQLDGLPEQMILASPVEERFVFVGWSMGGSTALRLACRFPQKVAGLVLVAATARMMEEKSTGWRGLSPRRLEALHQSIRITHGEGFFGLPPNKPNPFMLDSEENLARGIDYLLKTDLRGYLERIFAIKDIPRDSGGDRPLVGGDRPLAADGDSPLAAGGDRPLAEGDRPRAFPVHIFHSEHDGVVRPENALYLKRIFPNAELTLVPGTEHALPIFIPELIDAAVGNWLPD